MRVCVSVINYSPADCPLINEMLVVTNSSTIRKSESCEH